MILALDVGSSRLFGGVLQDGQVLASFHKKTSVGMTADEMGLFLLQWLQCKEFAPAGIEGIVFCSVVPELNSVVEESCREYLQREALALRAGVKSGLQVKYTNHQELGGDLIANAVAGVKLYPGKNLIIVDFGTATSLCAVGRGREYLGGTLVPGLQIAMEALAERTARLPAVEIRPASKVCGRDTVSGIQGGLYFGTLGMLKELISRMRRECFPDEEAVVVATGQYASLYRRNRLFDYLIPELVLLGLEEIRQLNLI